jgi:hypothetical protein
VIEDKPESNRWYFCLLFSYVIEESFPVCANYKSLKHHSSYTSAVTISPLINPEEMG